MQLNLTKNFIFFLISNTISSLGDYISVSYTHLTKKFPNVPLCHIKTVSKTYVLRHFVVSCFLNFIIDFLNLKVFFIKKIGATAP